MNHSTALPRQGHRLLQIGVALFLLTSFEGFTIPYLAAPGLGRSVHTLAGFTGVLLIAYGLVWPRLDLGQGASRIAFALLVYSSLATIAAFVLAAVWGAGGSVIPIAAGPARGSELEEAAITIVLYSAAPTGIAAFAMTLWGLRAAPAVPSV